MVCNNCHTCSQEKKSKLDPANHRAISFLPIPAKIFNHIIFQRIKQKSKHILRDNQFGFREERRIIDAIFIVPQVTEKAKDYSVNLHFNFIDFKSAFDTIFAKALWKMLKYVRVSRKMAL